MSLFTKSKGTAASGLPKPPTRLEMPICARCIREGGIMIYGRMHTPEKSAIHPDHVALDHDTGKGRQPRVIHRGPREPLCSHHVEILAREAGGKRLGYPAPVWTQPRRGIWNVDRVLDRLTKELASPTQGMRRPATQRTPSERDEESTRAVCAETLDREPGDDSAEIEAERGQP